MAILLPQPRTGVLQVHQEALMGVMEPQVREGLMDPCPAAPPVALMGVTGVSLTEDLQDTLLLQEMSLLVLTQKRTSGSTASTRTAVASSAERS